MANVRTNSGGASIDMIPATSLGGFKMARVTRTRVANDREAHEIGLADLPAVGSETTLPDAEGVLQAFQRVGYDLHEAIADLIDNSVDAGAGRVLIRFVRAEERLLRVYVVDDGRGMTARELTDAMAFGRRSGKGPLDLGKYGMGLKSASFSQCDILTVVSRRAGRVGGRRWTADNIRSGWLCDRLASRAAAGHLDQVWDFVDPSTSGTLIQWDELRLPIARDRVDAALAQLIAESRLHLAIHFHRLLEAGRIEIALDAVNVDTEEIGPEHIVEPMDPFAYGTSGRRGYPKTFRCEVSDIGRLKLEAHIWPRHSRLPGYRLGGGRVSQRQGFYFYRNDRLIQAGSWNGWRDDAEPHASLARVAVDLPSEFDDAFGLTLQKTGLVTPRAFLDALTAARSGRKPFTEYLQDAIETYRATGPPPVSEPPLAPVTGLTAGLRLKIRRILTDGGGGTRPMRFEWSELPADRFFKLDQDTEVIQLNSLYRGVVLNGARASSADAPLVKMLLFLLLREELDRERMSANAREWLEECQNLLVAAARSAG